MNSTGAEAWTGAERASLRLLRAAIAASVLLQRFALGGDESAIPVLLLVLWALTGYGYLRGLLRVDRKAAELVVALLAVITAVVLANTLMGRAWSFPSLFYLYLLYTPFALVLPACSPRVRDRALQFFLGIMAVFAAVAVVQIGVQFLGWQYRDVLFDQLPDQLVMPGFVTSYPIVWDSHIWRSNAVVFLEASFLSQYLGLAVLAHLALGRRAPMLILYLAGMVSAVSGTGFVTIAVGVAVLVARRAPGVTKRLAAFGVAGLIALAALPLGEVMVGRLQEFGQDGSSASVRFETPYLETAEIAASGPGELLFGLGPGAAARTLGQQFHHPDVEQDFPFVPAIPKLVVEYGVVAAVLLSALVVTLVRRGCEAWLALPLLAIFFVLTGSVQQPAILVPLIALARWAAPAMEARGRRAASPGLAPSAGAQLTGAGR